MKPALLDIVNTRVERHGRCILNNLNLNIKQQENVAIIGPNGSGKSTLLKLLSRDIYPLQSNDSHVKILRNNSVNVNELRQKIGVISQDLHNQYSGKVPGFETVLSGFFGSIGIRSHHQVSAEQIETTWQILRKLNCEHLADVHFAALSTGQQRQLLLGRAIVQNPQSLILDEPTNSLDIKATQCYLKLLRELLQNECSVILVTHKIEEIPPEVSRIIMIKNGNIIYDDAKEKCLTKDNISLLFDIPLDIIERQGFYQAIPA